MMNRICNVRRRKSILCLLSVCCCLFTGAPVSRAAEADKANNNKDRVPAVSLAWQSGMSVSPSSSATDSFIAEGQLRASSSADIMRENFRKKICLGDNYDVNDAKVKKKITDIATNATKYWNNMVKSPAEYLWSDYSKLKNDASNTPKHVYYTYGRLLTMAEAYAYTSSSLYKNAQLLEDIILALEFMYNYAFNESTPRIGNFWEWHMGTPDTYARIVSILYDDLPEKIKAMYTKTIVGQVRNFTITGNYTFGNQASICKSLFYCGVLSGNMADVQYALDNLIRAFVDNTTVEQRKSAQAAFENLWKAQGDYHNYPVLKKEGLYEDGTFIQHIALPYIGGYGAEIIDASAQMMSVLDGTGIQLSPEIQASLLNWIDKAYLPAIYEGEMMIMYMGRNVSKNPHEIARSIALDIAESAEMLQNEADRKRIQAVCKRMFTHNTYYTDMYSGMDPILDKPRLDGLLNNQTLPEASNSSFNMVMAAGDRVIHQRPSFRLGISMSSSRIGKFETLNNQNMKGWYTGDGMTYLYKDDRAQFVSYLSTVDAKRLPGTTVDVINRVADATSNYGLFGIPTNAKDWVGGVSLRKTFGTAGMDLVGQVSSLVAKKSWFMFDNEVVALGAGIKLSESRKVETIIENRKSLNPVTVDGVSKSQSKGWSEVLTNPSWIHMDGTSGYYFPEPTTVSAYRNYDGFTQFYIDHGTQPANGSYAYVLLPEGSKESTGAYAANPDIQVLSNTDKLQAVKENRLNIWGVNFWEAGEIDILRSEHPASVMMQLSNDTLYLSVSDPTWKQTMQRLRLQGSYRMVSEPTGTLLVSVSGNNTIILVNPSNKMGMTQEVVLVNNNSSSITLPESDKPVLNFSGERSKYYLEKLDANGSKVQVYTLTGELIRTDINQSTSLLLDLSAYPLGVYFVRYQSNKGESQVWKCIN